MPTDRRTREGHAMKLLVTGGAGFIGSNFVLHAIAAGHAVVNLDALTYAGNLANLASLPKGAPHVFVKGDIGDTGLVTSLLEIHRPDAIVNFAAESHVDRSIEAPAAFVETNVVGTFRLLDAVLKHWEGLDPAAARAFRFLHVSTDEVYGSLEAGAPAFTEAHPYEPNSPYSASKAASDHFVRAYHHTYGLPVLTTNCSNNYGPFHFPEKLIPLVIRNATAGKPLPVYGDGLQVRDWLYVADHCRAISAVLAQGMPGRTYNVGGDSEMANIDVVRMICAILDRESPRADGTAHAGLITHVKDRPGHDRRYAIDASRIRDELGWRPLETFGSGLLKTVRWYLANEAWVRDVTSGAYREWVARQYGS